MSKKTMGVAAATLLLAATAYAAPFQNGSFEAPGYPSGTITTLPSGDTTITGWTVTGANIDYLKNYWQAADGDYSLDLSGTGAGGIQQTFDTVPGHTYRVRFALAGNPDINSQPVKTVQVQTNASSPSSYSFNTQTAGSSGTDMKWSTQTYTFTATSSATTLSFTSLTLGVYGPALDNVVVSDITPSPVPTLSQWALIGLAGLLSLLAVHGRKLWPSGR